MSDALINGLAGAGGGIVAQLITYPLQTVNTRQQTERKPQNAPEEDLALTSGKRPARPTGTVQQMYQVIKDEGWGRLYSGLMPSLVGTAASQGVYYYFYQIFRNRVEAIAVNRRRKGYGDGSVGMFSSLLVAAFSGCLNVLLTNPIWVVVTRMQTHTKAKKKLLEAKDEEHTDPDSLLLPIVADELIQAGSIQAYPYGTGHAVQEVYDEAGLWGFWKGVFPTLIMVSNPSIQFMLYESLLQRLRAKRALNKQGLNSVTAVEAFFLGAIAKLGATVITYPLLVVKSRLQAKQESGGDKAHQYTGTLDAISRLQAKQESGGDKAHQYTGTLDAIVKIIHYEGLSGFYKGMSTKIAQSVFAAAILFMIKEELVKAARALVIKKRSIKAP